MKRLPIVEFVVLIAMLFALVAFATDAMLPGFPAMAAELTPGAPNRIQLVIAAFMAGLGLGTFLAGPLADAAGRKPVVVLGAALFILGALICWQAATLEALLAGRFLQGLGAAGPRIAPLAMVRDLFEGRRMAQITSLIMAVFLLVPAVAPWIGSLILAASGWRAIFFAFVLFALVTAAWLMLRQGETLAPENRKRLHLGQIAAALAEIAGNRAVVLYAAALTLGFTQLLAVISSIQPIYDQAFGRAASFPAWFALGAVIAMGGTFSNAALVMRLGMRRLAITGFAAQTGFALVALLLLRGVGLGGGAGFALWFLWSTSTFFMAGLTFGNLNALALQPLGHIAGTAASMITGISTVGASLLIIPIGQSFDGTPGPLILGNLICAAVALAIMSRTVEAQEA